jgi:hypothetical protein
MESAEMDYETLKSRNGLSMGEVERAEMDYETVIHLNFL